jgi:hypothetical protein
MKNPIRSLAFIVLSLLSSLAVAGAETSSWESQNSGLMASNDSLVIAKLPAKKVKVRITESQSSSPAKPSSGFWWSVYTGMDIATLGDISNYVNSAKQTYLSEDLSANSSADHAGILGGTEFGFDLDKTDSLSLSFEKVWTSNQTVNASDGGDRVFNHFDPSLLGVSLNYTRVVDDHPGSKLSFALGLGYYHADMDVKDNPDPSHDYTGNFGGDILGGTLGIKEELSIAGDLGVEFTARGRIANFSQLTAKSLSYNGADQTGGPFTLVNVNEPSYQIMPIPTSVALPPGINHTQLDYSGFDGNVALVWHL